MASAWEFEHNQNMKAARGTFLLPITSSIQPGVKLFVCSVDATIVALNDKATFAVY